MCDHTRQQALAACAEPTEVEAACDVKRQAQAGSMRKSERDPGEEDASATMANRGLSEYRISALCYIESSGLRARGERFFPVLQLWSRPVYASPGS